MVIGAVNDVLRVIEESIGGLVPGIQRSGCSQLDFQVKAYQRFVSLESAN